MSLTLTDASRSLILEALNKAARVECDNVEHCGVCWAYLDRDEVHCEGCLIEASLRILETPATQDS